MLTRSFTHIPGIGTVTERRLWQAGVRSWDDFLANPQRASRFVSREAEQVVKYIELSLEAVEDENWMFFYRALPSCDHWRLLNLMPGRTAYLDIETTGLSAEYNEITCIGLYDGMAVRYYTRGHNLEEFAQDIHRYGLIVTYNGKRFDLPFIRRQLGIALDVPNVDLRYCCARVGLKGGLKVAEKLAGIGRDDSLEGVDGFVAVLLWQVYERTGDPAALETLIAYNLADTVNLLPLAQEVWNRMLPAYFSELRVAVDHSRPPLPVKPDRELLARLMGEMGRYGFGR